MADFHASRILKSRQGQSQAFTDKILQDTLDVLDSLRTSDTPSSTCLPGIQRRVMVDAVQPPAFLEITTNAARLETGQVGVSYAVAPAFPDQAVPPETMRGMLADVTARMESALASDERFQAFDETFCQALNSRILQSVKEAGLFDPANAPRELKNPDAERATMQDKLSRLYHAGTRNVYDEQRNEAPLALVTAPLERGMEDAKAAKVRHIVDRTGNIPYGACWAEGAEDAVGEIIDRHLPEGKIGYSQQRTAEDCQTMAATSAKSYTNSFAVSGSEQSVKTLQAVIGNQLHARTAELGA